MAKKIQWAVRTPRVSVRRRTTWADERYAPGHVETVDEFFKRGGTITYGPASVSQDRLDWPSLIASALGQSADDVARGFAWSDLTSPVREAIASQSRGSLVFAQQETWE